MHSGVIVLSPPWPRSGSSNTFAGQTATHARRGARVLLLLYPFVRGQRQGKVELWQDALAAMAFPGVTKIAYARVGSARIRSFMQWLWAGRDDSIAVMARYAASAKMPPEVDAFMRSTRVDLIHANHVFSIGLARRIADAVQARQGRRPPIILDTHDVQSQAIVSGGRVNKQSGRIDSADALLQTELALCAHADMLTHCSPSDRDFFAERLPQRPHALILPTLHPDAEAELKRRRGLGRPAGPDFVYLGTSHEANLETVRWLLREVLPLAGPDMPQRVRIAGTVGKMLRSRDPDLYCRHEGLFLGEVASVYDLYTSARAILAPATSGTGSSVKLIEALCIGKPVLTTAHGLRGLPPGQPLGDGLLVHDDAAAFASAMSRLAAGENETAAAQGTARLYDEVFSNERFFAALSAAIDRLMVTFRANPSGPACHEPHLVA